MNDSGSTRQLAKGGVAIVGATFGSKILQVAAAIILIRLISPSEYGIVSLGNAFVAMLVPFATFGFRSGLPYFVAKFRNAGRSDAAAQVIASAVGISAFAGFLFSVALYLSASWISASWAKPELSVFVKIVALAIPATVLIQTITAAYRGFEVVATKVWFENIGEYLVRLVLLIGIGVYGLGYLAVPWVYLISPWCVIVAYVMYSMRHLRRAPRSKFNIERTRELLVFSSPLLWADVLENSMHWFGNLFLGYVHSAEEVGYFNASLRIAAMLAIPAIAFSHLYLPIATRSLELGTRDRLIEVFRTVTRWSSFLTMPVLVYLIIDAEYFLAVAFGPEYKGAVNVFRMLLVAFASNSLFGPNKITLVASNFPKQVLYSNLIAVGVSATLLLLLAPPYGAIGAATAVAAGKVLSNAYVSWILLVRCGIHPFSREYVVPLACVLVAGTLVALMPGIIGSSQLLIHLLAFAMLMAVALIAPVATKSMSTEDLELIGEVERRLTGRQRMVEWMSSWLAGRK